MPEAARDVPDRSCTAVAKLDLVTRVSVTTTARQLARSGRPDPVRHYDTCVREGRGGGEGRGEKSVRSLFTVNLSMYR